MPLCYEAKGDKRLAIVVRDHRQDIGLIGHPAIEIAQKLSGRRNSQGPRFLVVNEVASHLIHEGHGAGDVKK